MGDAIGGDFLQPVGEVAAERGGDLDVESPAHERESERFGGLAGDLDADAAEDALARFEQHVTRMEFLAEGAALPGEPAGLGAVDLGVVLQGAVSGSPAIAVETPR